MKFGVLQRWEKKSEEDEADQISLRFLCEMAFVAEKQQRE